MNDLMTVDRFFTLEVVNISVDTHDDTKLKCLMNLSMFSDPSLLLLLIFRMC